MVLPSSPIVSMALARFWPVPHWSGRGLIDSYISNWFVFLRTHKSAWHCWRTLREDPNHSGPPESKRARTAARRAVWVSTRAQHDAAAGLPCRKVNRNFDERRLTGAVSWMRLKPSAPYCQRPPLRVNSLELPIFPGENDAIISWSPNVANVLPSCHAGWDVQGWTRLPRAVQSVCKRHIHTVLPRRTIAARGRHGFVVTSQGPSLLVCYLEATLGTLDVWLQEWRFPINASKSTALPFVKATRRIQIPRKLQFLGEPIQWVETFPYLGVPLDTQLTWSAHINQMGKKAAQRLGVLVSLLNRRSVLSVRNGVLLCRQLSSHVMDYACRSGGRLSAATSESC
jgi:hypothetical protein